MIERPMKQLIKVITVFALLLISGGIILYSLISNGIINISTQNEVTPINHINVSELSTRNLDIAKIYNNLGDLEPLARDLNDKALKEFESRNGVNKPFSENAKKAISYYTAYLVGGDFYGVGLFQEAYTIALKLYCQKDRDPLIDAIVFHHDYKCTYFNRKGCYDDVGGTYKNLKKSNYPNIYKLAFSSLMLSTLGCTIDQKTNWQEDLTSIVSELPNYYNDFISLWSESLTSQLPAKFLNNQGSKILNNIGSYASVMDLLNKNIDTILQNSKIPEATADYIKGVFYTAYAWTARGSDFADKVKEDSWPIFSERLKKAESVLIPAIEKFPNDPYLSGEMLTVVLGKQEDRNTMESYFKKAVAADPTYLTAYIEKMWYLAPRWYGTPQDVLAFGAECLKTDDWKHRIPYVMAKGIFDLSPSGQKEIYQNDDLWKISQYVSEEYLKRYPESIEVRTKYFRNAVYGKRWDVAREQSKMLGSNWDRGVLSKSEYIAMLVSVPKITK